MHYKLFFYAALFFLVSCSNRTTSLTDSRTYDESRTGTVNKILIVGVSDNGPVRNLFEKEMEKQLEKYDVVAERSLEKMPREDSITRQAFEKYFAEDNIDAILLTRVIDIEKVAGYAAGEDYSTTPPMMNNFYSFYYDTYDRTAEPGHFEYAQIMRIETNIFNVDNGKVIWQCHSDSFNKENAPDIISDLTKMLAKTMHEDGIITK